MKTTLYVVEQTRFPYGTAGSLVTPEGETLHSHMSSSLGWLEADLTRSFGRRAELEARYPDGYEIKVISLDDTLPDEIAGFFG